MAKREIPFFRTAYNYDMNAASDETGIACDPEEGMTQQQFAEECDINTIVKRFGLTGVMPENHEPPQFGDFTGVMDFHTATNAIRQAQESFMAMPADVRARFGNDPQRLMEFVEDGKNYDEAVAMGLALKRPAPERSTTQAVDELAAKFDVKPTIEVKPK